ncbi:hypothetical protein MPSEU_000167100 [Mayamaea pseudoterrestris]|nr:hypothetical protein MPSEU_000167100 [Mayamaea pseudoterrestris]
MHASRKLVLYLSLLQSASCWIPSASIPTAERATSEIRSRPLSSRTLLYSTPALVKNDSPSLKPASAAWFPTRIQDSFPYDQLVERLFVRQVVTLTRDMAQLALSEYQHLLLASTMRDPFAHVATLMSADVNAKIDQGSVGWVNAPMTVKSTGDDDTALDDEHEQRLPTIVLQELFQRQPKPGDILMIQGTDYWHVIQVLEIWMKDPVSAIANGPFGNTQQQTPIVGSYSGVNSMTPVKKLKGKGILPEFPELRTYTIQTAGCQMNMADSERLAGILESELQLTRHDASDVANNSNQQQQLHADLIVLNTCSIRDHAEQKVYDALGPYAARKRQGQGRVAIIVTGCVAQQEGLRLVQRVPEIDAVVGPQYVPHMKRILEQVARGQQVVVTEPLLMMDAMSSARLDNGVDASSFGHPEDASAAVTNQPIRNHPVRAWVNVMYGCNEHCSYCVVPATRGMEQSRSMESILEECLTLTSKTGSKGGYKEVTLIGQNVDAYGRDMVPRRTFAELLEFLNSRLPDKMRIRYVTSHPRYFSDRVIDAVANLDKVCECFHMPFQAGDDEVLKRMRRGYTFDSYMKIISRIKEKCPNAGITADIIVGFPGETEEAFQRTLDLMEAVKFDNVNSFTYSPRPNTEAALFDDQITEDVKSERLQRVQQLATTHALERSQRYLGKTVEVLVEDSNPRSPSQVMGRTREGRQVYFDGDLDILMGQLVMVDITEARTWSLMGRRAQQVAEDTIPVAMMDISASHS